MTIGKKNPARSGAERSIGPNGIIACMNNSPTSTIQQHPAAAETYIRHGWRIIDIPHGSKAPTRTGWNQEGGWLTSAAYLPPRVNLGLLHAFSGTMALDIDNWDASVALLAEVGINLNQIYSAPDAVTIESGRPGHGKLLYAMPFPGFVLPTKRIMADDAVAFELRCGTSGGTSVQDVLPPSLHPETGQAYRWGGQGHWDRLPTLPSDLLEFWQDQIRPSPAPSAEGHLAASTDDIRKALEHIPAECPREQWLQVGMALHHEGIRVGNTDMAYQTFLAWSAGDPTSPPHNYKGEQDIRVTWRSFKIDHSNPVTIATLFSIAKDNGWRKEAPSAEALFSSVNNPLDLFDALRVPPPRLDLDIIPKVLADRSSEIADIVGCDPLVPLFAGLGTVCGAVDSRSRLRLADGYEVPPILWLSTIGNPSDKKSPGSKPMISILRQIEREDLPRFKKAELEYSVQKDIYTKRYTSYMEWYAENDGFTDNTVPPEEPIAPVEPAKLVMVVQDITSQKLMHHGAKQPRGLLCHLDEMNGWAKALVQKNGSENTSTWIQGYESGYARMDRVGAGTLEADPFSVAIFGNVQPQVWRDNLALLSADGFMSRFLVAPLRGRYTKLSQPVPDALTMKAEYESMIRQIYALPKQTYDLSPEAFTLYRENQAWVLNMQAEERIVAKDMLDKSFEFALGKSDGTVGRIAFVFHLIENPMNPVVSGETMHKAISFFRNYCLRALRYAYAEMGGVGTDSLEVWTAKHILAIAHNERVTLRDIKHSARRQLEAFAKHTHVQVMLDSMVPLEDSNWVMLVDSDPRRNEYTWAINPGLKTAFADYRKQVLTIRQKRVDEIVASAERNYGHAKRRLIPGYDPEWD